MPFMSFGSYLRQKRESSGRTIKEVAERLGFSSSYVSQLENGTRVPSAKQMSILATAYGLPEADLKKRWTEAKILKVSMDTNYKFNMKDVGEKRVHDATAKMEQGLEELRKTFSVDGHFKLPVIVAIPIDNLDDHLSNTSEFVMLPKEDFPNVDHRVFGIRVSDLDLQDAGIIAGDFIILDADIPPKNGDIVIVGTPDGLIMTHYFERGDNLELRPEKEGFKKTYRLTESKIIGRLIYHLKKY
jgi:transcriptional regulator with XRE-family HTH domain